MNLTAKFDSNEQLNGLGLAGKYLMMLVIRLDTVFSPI